MLITGTLLILIVIVMFSIILGNDFVSGLVEIGVDNTALVNGTITTYVVPTEDILFTIDTTTLIIAGIALLTTIIFIAGITGVQVLGSGLNQSSVRIIILLTGYIGIWTTLSILSFSLINSIEIFGSVIYISLTLGYTIGVIKSISGGND